MIKNKIFVIKNGCPLCGGDVIGNDEVKYYCKHCNMLFEFKDLNLKALKNIRPAAEEESATKKGRSSKEEGIAPKKDFKVKEGVGIENVKVGTVKNKVKTGKEKQYFVASKLSDKFHIPQCPFAKNINSKNLIIFKSRKEALKAGFKACKCAKL